MQRYRTIWISDVHLGTRGCKAEFLLDFLRHNDADTIYLVGDIIDGWRLKKSWYWPQTHNDVVQKLLRMVRKGTRAIYVPGNHDEWLRGYARLQFGGVEVLSEAMHVTADGRRLLVIHGDAFDAVVTHARWLALLGDGAYTVTLWLNRHFNTARRRLGYPYWSLSAYLKGRVKNAMQYIVSFGDAIADEARRRGADGVVCGHIHHAEIRDYERHSLLQQRRLGRELHSACRAIRRPAGAGPLDVAPFVRCARDRGRLRAGAGGGGSAPGRRAAIRAARTCRMS